MKRNQNIYKILFLNFLILIYISNFFEWRIDSKFNSIFIKKINEIYSQDGVVNLNEIEEKINIKKLKTYINKSNEINIGIGIDRKYTLQAMMTLASVMDTQKSEKWIRFHIAIVEDFQISDMVKIYSLRKNVRNESEFNFYNTSKVEKDLIGLNTKGSGIVARLLLPNLLPNDINKLLFLDPGDSLVIKDLTELFNWDMKNNIIVGVPDSVIGKKSIITKQIYKSYVNIGSCLVNVTLYKSDNVYEKLVKYKAYYHSHCGEQDLLNDILIGKIGMYPIKFGHISPFKNDEKLLFPNYFKKNLTSLFPINITEYLISGYTPFIIHQWNSKWHKGFGLTIFRRIAQYYIRYAGIWEEMCKIYPLYCIK